MRSLGMQNFLCFSTLAVSVACLAGAFLPYSGWLGLAVVGGMGLLQLAVWVRPVKGLASVNLVLYTVLAGVRVLEDSAPLALTIGITAALAYWELVQFRHKQRVGFPAGRAGSTEADPALSKNHLQSLGLSAGLGLLLVGIGWVVRLPLPFAVVMGLVLVMFLGLDRVLRWFISGRDSSSISHR